MPSLSSRARRTKPRVLLFRDDAVAVGVDPGEHSPDALGKLLVRELTVAVVIVPSEELLDRRAAVATTDMSKASPQPVTERAGRSIMPRPPDPGLQGQRQWLLVLTRLSIAPAETGRNAWPEGSPRSRRFEGSLTCV
jgi:hypothetical protein